MGAENGGSVFGKSGARGAPGGGRWRRGQHMGCLSMRVTVGGGEITEGIGTDSEKGEVLGRCRFGNLGFFECIEFSEIRRELRRGC